MKRMRILILCIAMLALAGCNERDSASQQTIRRLEQQNQTLQNNLHGAQSVGGTLGITIVILGSALAVSLAFNMVKGRGSR